MDGEEMRVDIVVVATNQPELLQHLFETARAPWSQLRFRVHVHSRDEDVLRVCRSQMNSLNMNLYSHGSNRGLARSWNDGILSSFAAGADVVLVLNDDVWFSIGDIDKIARAAVERREHYVLFCEGLNVHRGTRVAHHFSCFAINPIALKRLGCFDENFFPVGLEDVDYVLRARNLGMEPYTVTTTDVFHAVAATRRGSELRARLEAAQRESHEYFRRKWGAEWGGNRRLREHPFNNPQFGMRIAPEVRHLPYPGHNRKELEDRAKEEEAKEVRGDPPPGYNNDRTAEGQGNDLAPTPEAKARKE
jgi:GT2 family glycosyltransferase